MTSRLVLLDRIHHDGQGPGSWVGEWCAEGDRQRAAGRVLPAIAHYNLARFPYVDGPARAEALRQCIDTFTGWALPRGISRLEVPTPSGTVRAWTSGIAPGKPVLLMCGGIVSIKEQWATALTGIVRLGFAGVVLELPGVGENTMRYDAESRRMVGAVLDAVDADRAYLLAFSFSGHLALHAAADDPRIRGIVTAGAPIREFFTDAAWQRNLPRVTVDTLAHLTGGDVAHLRSWAIDPAALAALDIPVGYAASARDEIIPSGDVALVARHVRRLDLISHDDVHGSPHFVVPTRLWAIRAVLRMRGGHAVHRFAVGTGLTFVRLAARLHSSARTALPTANNRSGGDR